MIKPIWYESSYDIIPIDNLIYGSYHMAQTIWYGPYRMGHTIWPRWKPNPVHPKNRVEDTNVIVVGDSMTRSVHDATSVLKVNEISSIQNCFKTIEPQNHKTLEPTRTGFIRATLTISGTARTFRYRLFRCLLVLMKISFQMRIASNMKILHWAIVQ